MANRKISDLTALTTPATGDLLPIVDISEAAAADKNKKITFGELFASIPAGTAAAPSIAFEGDSNTGVYSPGADQVAIATGGNERARIDSSGRLLLGTSSSTDDPNARLLVEGGRAAAFKGTGGASEETVNVWNTATSGTRYQVVFREGAAATLRGSITTDGSLTSYNTTSDYRLKENVVPLTGAADRVIQLQVHRFNFIADPDHTVDGFIAHEAQAVVPECVTGEKDAVDADGNPVMQGIDQSKLVPLLTAALQEAIAKIEALETRLSALEGN